MSPEGLRQCAVYPESDLRMVRFDSDYVMLPSCPVYPVLAHSCISFCPCYLSYVIELLASLTLYRDIQEVQPLAPWPVGSVPLHATSRRHTAA